MSEEMTKEVYLIGELIRELFDKYNRIESKKLLYKDAKELTLIEVNTILVIGRGEKVKSMSQIANTLGVSFGTPTVTVDRLISKGYVERNRDEEDRRQVFVSLSPKGEAIFQLILELKNEVTKKIYSILDQEEQKALINILSKINNRFDEVVSAML